MGAQHNSRRSPQADLSSNNQSCGLSIYADLCTNTTFMHFWQKLLKICISAAFCMKLRSLLTSFELGHGRCDFFVTIRVHLSNEIRNERMFDCEFYFRLYNFLVMSKFLYWSPVWLPYKAKHINMLCTYLGLTNRSFDVHLNSLRSKCIVF